ncbi:MAG: ThiF family adenylyltransferase, partial [Vampirovibrionia bacterium]
MVLSKEQQGRYSRNILLENVGEKGQKKLLKSSVLVAGAGGLGSPVIAYLTAAGVGRIGIVDFDQIEASNLNRQILHSRVDIGMHKVFSAKAFVNNLNPDIEVDVYNEKITYENVKKIIEPYQCVVDCLDTIGLSFLLNDACVEMNKTFMHAGVVAYGGQFMTVVPAETSCLRCLFPEQPNENLDVDIMDVGILGAAAGVMGSILATEVFKYLVGLECSTNTLVVYDSISQSFRHIVINKQNDCPVCSKGKMLSEAHYSINDRLEGLDFGR